ncbi:YcxB family protein [Nitratireductor sp. ZSWI3]|uniref:YcxB family protein n=1 Tax=Nitratireductor sp. ZSWI3 TaxID=2966359 RepID=UPI00214F8D14|nr:YcxB family protein [Nitratireductor sp. ZSWI3]MCR4269252.1 YcxB family protein [Nitratireductor sp. ZSWI3]
MLDVDDHVVGRYGRTAPLQRLPFLCATSLVGLFIGLIYGFDWYQRGEIGPLVLSIAVSAGIGLVAGWASYGFFSAFAQGLWRGYLEKREAVGVPVAATADAQGLTVRLRGQTWVSPWDSLLAVEEDDRLFYFWTSKYQAHVWPKRAFDSPEEQAAFRSSLEEWTGSAPASPPLLAGNVTPEY